MSEPYLGEVKIISWNYAPRGWAFCNGQLLPLNQNQPLFSLLGTRYGGNGQTNFALPDMRGRAPVHTGGPIGAIVGGQGGEEFHTLTLGEMPTHNHFVNASNTAGNVNNPSGALLGANASPIYQPPGSAVAMAKENITFVGGDQPHENRSPYLVLNFIIALQGIFPSRN
ncbi:tail fiber protein [Mesorhizobium sp. L2C067A000]|uniref:phage tail protein n=1 Tax=Mesorhizobium sp. L2C067A000 TaxID=1287106 RepID=UPI0003CFABFB|nr:tail fiber protein [Mesorhizobium sp. L2C067A000]ESZ32521.1 microcystin dependent protein [Mesorhizobium sp. L2C067A000]